MMRLWIDTDPALGYEEDGRPRDVDDAFCIVEAIASPRIDLVGITTVFGNSPAHVGREIAQELVRIMAADISVIGGADSAAAGANDAADAMAAALSEGPMRILAIGPVSNLAALIRRHPELLTNIQEVVVVAGRSEDQVIELHGIRGVPDFNFERDVDAFQTLMESPVPVAFTGFELSSQVVLTRADLEGLYGRSPIANHLANGALPWLEWFTGVFPKSGGFHPWDSAALAYLLHPEFFQCEARGWRIRSRPKDTPATGSHWLELGGALPGKRSVYCTGFMPDGKKAFIQSTLAGIP